MSKAMLNIYVRTFRRRMDAGETFEEILASYPRLTDEQAQEIKGALEEYKIGCRDWQAKMQ